MFRAFSFLVALVLPFAVFANSEFDYLLGDLTKFEEDLEANIDSLMEEMESHSFLQSAGLLPESSGTRAEALSENAFAPFISVRVDGVPVELADVPTDAWFAPYVRDAADRGIVSGYRGQDGRPLGMFGPGDSVTVEQLAKIAIEASGRDPVSCAEGGTLRNKTAGESWSKEYVLCAEALGWAVFSDGSVDVHAPATRSQVVVTVLQAFEVVFGRALGTVFADVNTSTEFSGAIEKAANDNLISGYADANGVPTGLFGPLDAVKRAEIAKIITLALQVYAE